MGYLHIPAYPAGSLHVSHTATLPPLFMMFNCAAMLSRFPRTLAWVLLESIERLYLASFPLIQLFVTLFPLVTSSTSSSTDTTVMAICEPTDDFLCPEPDPVSQPKPVAAMEFLPLMLTSVYCAIGLVWAFVRLSYIYLRDK